MIYNELSRNIWRALQNQISVDLDFIKFPDDSKIDLNLFISYKRDNGLCACTNLNFL